MKNILGVVVVILLAICICSIGGCRQEETPVVDNTCNHEWYDIGYRGGVNLYCPKCKSEITVSLREMQKMVVDQEYREKQEEK